MTVSIIIPVFNAENYVERCLDSVCAQSFCDIECIVVDDASTDGSRRAVDRYVAAYRGPVRFRVVGHEMNGGQSAARNTGLRHATGDYVFFLDSDDAIVPGAIATLADLATRHPDADFVQGNMLSADGNVSPYGRYSGMPEYCTDRHQLEELILSYLVSSACNRLIRRTFITGHDLFFPEGMLHEDMYWCYFVAKHVRAASFTLTGTYIYYTTPGSTMTSVSTDKRIRRYTSRLRAAEAFYRDMLDTPPSRRQRIYLAGNLTSAMIEVCALHSPRHWWRFWRFVVRLARPHLRRLSAAQWVLLACMLPPLCFLVGHRAWYWRLQQNIVNRT